MSLRAVRARIDDAVERLDSFMPGTARRDADPKLPSIHGPLTGSGWEHAQYEGNPNHFYHHGKKHYLVARMKPNEAEPVDYRLYERLSKRNHEQQHKSADPHSMLQHLRARRMV